MDLRRLGELAAGAVDGSWATARVAVRTGVASPIRPDRLLGMANALRHWGMSPAAICAINAARDPGRTAVIDERESLTYAEIDRRSSVVAATLGESGIGAGDAVALLARNSAAFIVAQVAVSKLGADVLYVNTGFAGPQLGDVLANERAAAVIADDEFDPLLDQVAGSLPRLTAWVEDGGSPPMSVAGLVAAADAQPSPSLPSPAGEGRHIILTSGTTGAPKGAARGVPRAISAAVAGVALLDAIPYRARRTTLLAAPAFHAWGLGNLVIGMLLQSTFVLTRRFDPLRALDLIDAQQIDTLVAVPVMCRRLLDVESDADTSSLRIVALSGSALPAGLPGEFMDRFGDVLYSLYGSTEVAFVSVAGPQDLRVAPSSAGHILRGVTVRLVDADDREVSPGEAGRVYAGGALSFDGYTGGEDKDRFDGLVATGDVGRIAADGRLSIEGRVDDMIVSGGENVFPGEVEGILHTHPEVADAAVVGVDDEAFGQALVAHVVLRAGATVSGDELRAYVKKYLATFKVPRDVVLHDELPRNETGKVVKRALTEG